MLIPSLVVSLEVSIVKFCEAPQQALFFFKVGLTVAQKALLILSSHIIVRFEMHLIEGFELICSSLASFQF